MGYFDAAIKRQQEENELAHHGILGQKWGIRRFQNKDGTRTVEGKKRYKKDSSKSEDSKEASKKKPLDGYSVKNLSEDLYRWEYVDRTYKQKCFNNMSPEEAKTFCKNKATEVLETIRDESETEIIPKVSEKMVKNVKMWKELDSYEGEYTNQSDDELKKLFEEHFKENFNEMSTHYDEGINVSFNDDGSIQYISIRTNTPKEYAYDSAPVSIDYYPKTKDVKFYWL